MYSVNKFIPFVALPSLFSDSPNINQILSYTHIVKTCYIFLLEINQVL